MDAKACLEDIAIGQYSPGVILPLGFNSTLDALYNNSMTPEQQTGVKASFKSREIMKPFLETYFLLVEIKSPKLAGLGVVSYKGWIKPVVYETPSDVKLPFNEAQPVIVGNQIVVYFPFLQESGRLENDNLVEVTTADFKHCKIDEP